MLKFYAGSFVSVWRNLTRIEDTLALHSITERKDPDLEQILIRNLETLETECARLPVSSSLLAQIARVREKVPQATFDPKRREEVLILLGELRFNLDHELAGHLFYVVAEKNAHLMDSGAIPFSENVGRVFHEATQDILAAGRCLALAEGTACVFHCMRALEHGLRAFAEHVGVTMRVHIDTAEWMAIIEAIETEVKRMKDLPKGPDKTRRTEFCSKAASQFRYFKDAWRNHVSHSRRSYSEAEAADVWDHTKRFMCEMAEELNPPLPETPAEPGG